ncbi:MAG: tetratricopeptide repeat protein [Flavobacteriales bacterium]
MLKTTLKYFLIICAVFSSSLIYSQNTALVEGYQKILKRGVSDSLFIKLNIDIADEFIFNNPDTSAFFTKNALDRAYAIKDSASIAKAENFLGIIHYSKGNLLTSLEHYQKSQRVYKEIGDNSGAVKAANNIAIVYTALGEHQQAIKIYEEAFQTNIDLNLIDEAASNIFNIAASYLELKNYEKVRASVKELEKFSKLSSTSIDPCFIKSELYIVDNKLDSAIICLERSANISIKEGDEFFLASVTMRMADVRIKQRDFIAAKIELESAERIIIKNDFSELMLNLLELKGELYSELGQYQKAYEFMQEYTQVKDSLNTLNNFNRISELNMKYETEKREADKAKLEQIVSQKNSLFKIIFIVLAAVIIILGVYVYNYTRKKKLSSLLKLQNNEIKIQRHKIISSINYAKRIQNSILPSKDLLKDKVPNSFVYFKPKDIVSGDFYWYRFIDGKLYIAAIDCTGHGVPGAFMSLIANSKLNRTVDEYKLRDPGEILKKLHFEIISILNQEKEPQNAQDGLDIGLCAIDLGSGEIQFAGANHGLFLIKDDELVEIKSKPISIGGLMFERQFDKTDNLFTTEVLHIEPGDSLFMCSDGIVDQLGGSHYKKFNKSNFKNFLSQLNALPGFDLANEYCEEVLGQWRGQYDQTDDMLLIGLKF